jgi:serine/threonine protein kinase
MDGQRYERLMDLFDESCDQPLSRQRQIVSELRARDVDLADRLAKLLKHDAAGTDVLAPAAGARALADELVVERQISDSMMPEHGTREGTTVGQWVVGEHIGSGGVGTVHRATHAGTGELVAIKFLKSVAVADPDNVTRLRREFRNLLRLKHPGVLQVFEESHGPSGHYIVMEYAEGGDLRRLMKAELSVLLPVLHQVALALAYVHSEGIVHRDLKPANVLLSGNPRKPKLADFGIAKVPDATAVITGTGVVMGSIDYLAPEQINGKPADERSDMYAFGCVIHALASGKPPFGGDNFERLYARLRGEPPLLSQYVPAAPPALVELTNRLMARDPQQRPSDFAAIAAAVAAVYTRA